jgi:branched-chain amino acid transport system permease protein
MGELKIGQDRWAAEAAARSDRRRQRWSEIVRRVETANPLLLVGALAALGAVVVAAGNDYLLRVAAMACVMAILALGLSVIVGLVGLLDLGYIAFAAVGGYTYALLSSDQLGVQLPSWAGLSLAVLLAVGMALLLALPALRLSGDHLAIVTLGFAQVVLLLAVSMSRVAVPWSTTPLNVTGGPNGIVGIARIRLLGWEVAGQRPSFILLLAVLGLLFLGLTALDRSPLGRAWRATREDALAAAALGLPVRQLKLLAVAAGAATAGLGGALYAAWQGAVFPTDFGLDVLLTLYAMVLLGGLGSLPGAVLGALLLAVVPELLRSPATAHMLFYGGLAVALLSVGRRGAVALGLAALLGVLVRLTAPWLWSDAVTIQGWLAVPRDATTAGNLAFVAAVGLLLAASRVRRAPVQVVLLALALYGLIFAWEVRLAEQPSVARQLLFGAALVILVIYRPYGLLGRPRVEVG